MSGSPRLTKGMATSLTSIAVQGSILTVGAVNKAESLKILSSAIVYHSALILVNFP